MSRCREAQMERLIRRSAPEESLGLCLKRPPEQSGQADARQMSRNNDGCGSCGDPVQERKAAGRL